MSDSRFPYLPYDDLARLEYGRMLWRKAEFRERLRQHWLDERHPHHERFAGRQQDVEAILSDPRDDLDQIDRDLRANGTSLRAMLREIPPVFGSFF